MHLLRDQSASQFIMFLLLPQLFALTTSAPAPLKYEASKIAAAEVAREACDPALRPDDHFAGVLEPEGDAVGVAVVIDPMCDYLGKALVEALLENGVAVATAFSDYMATGLALQFDADLPRELLTPSPGREGAWLPEGLRPLACYSESDAGVATAERLAEAAGCLFRNAADGERRRHKWLLHEALGEAGLPRCRQRLCETPGEAAAFFEEEGRRIVVKPCRGVGSEGVALCASGDEAIAAFDALRQTSRYGGGPNDLVLAQSFLDGPEYAVDSVSRNGEHKVTAVWKYDKRPVGRAPFVYHATRLIDSGEAAPVLDMLRKALDAAGHRQGPAHSELIDDSVQGPTLVEINARFHNANVRPLVGFCIHSPDAIDLSAAACLPASDAWDAAPADATLAKAGALVHLVCKDSGVLERLEAGALAALEGLQTLLDMEIYERFRLPGAPLEPTTDIKTDAGWLLLAGSAEDVQADYERVLEAQERLFVLR